MKQIQLNQFGQPSTVAKRVEVPDVGAPCAWEVVVNIEAFPINPADLAMISGRYGNLPKLPSTIGMEAVGRVSETGSSVKNVAVGDRVVLIANNNWMERRKVPAAAVHRVSEDLEVDQLAMLKVNPATAYLLLTEIGKLERDSWVIQNAPLSSVGRCVIQIAKSLGIRTINIVRRPEAKVDVLALGGDVAIVDGPDVASQVRSHIGTQPLKIALDAVAGTSVQRLAESLTEGGMIINYGMLSGEACQLSAEQTIFRGIQLTGFWVSKILNRLSLAERTGLFDQLADLMRRNVLRMQIDQCFEWTEFETALRRAEQPDRHGKVIVRVGKGIS